jgi:hypothetical protein
MTMNRRATFNCGQDTVRKLKVTMQEAALARG